MEKPKYLSPFTPVGWIAVLFLIALFSYGTANTFLLNKSNFYEKGVVSEILGGKGVVIEYFHPQKKRICTCNQNRVYEETSEIGKEVIIKLHPYFTWVCRIDWKKTRKYLNENNK